MIELVKNISTQLEPDVVEIVKKIRQHYNMSLRVIVNEAIRNYWKKKLEEIEKRKDTGGVSNASIL